MSFKVGKTRVIILNSDFWVFSKFHWYFTKFLVTTCRIQTSLPIHITVSCKLSVSPVDLQHCLLRLWQSNFTALTHSKYHCKGKFLNIILTMPSFSLVSSLLHQIYIPCLTLEVTQDLLITIHLEPRTLAFGCLYMKFSNKPLSILSCFREEANTLAKSLSGIMSRTPENSDDWYY